MFCLTSPFETGERFLGTAAVRPAEIFAVVVEVTAHQGLRWVFEDQHHAVAVDILHLRMKNITQYQYL